MIYFSADWHLVDRMWTGEPRLDGDSYRMLNRLVDSIIADDVGDQGKALVIAGYITDSRAIEGRALYELESAVRRLFEAGVGVMFIQGNHDRSAVHHLSVCGGVQMENGVGYEIDGWNLVGLNYMPRTKLQETVLALGTTDILVVHCAFQHLLGFEGAYDLSVAELPLAVRNVVVGDVHKKDLLSPKDRTGWVLSPGALQACDIGQGDDHGYWKLAPKASGAWPVYVRLPHRSIKRFLFTEEDSLEELQAQLLELATAADPEELPLVEIKYVPERATEVVPLLAMYRSRLILRDSEQRITSKDRAEVQPGRLYNRITLRNALDLRMNPEDDSPVYQLLAAVLETPDNAKQLITNYSEQGAAALL